MNTVTPERWTWADLVSSYRFWALVIFFLTIFGSIWIFNMRFPFLMRSWVELPYAQLGMAMGMKPIGLLAGVILAWLISRRPSLNCLYLIAALYVAAMVLACFSMANMPLIYLAFFLTGLVTSSAALLLPALIGRAVGGIEPFVLAFGLFMILRYLLEMIAAPLAEALTPSSSESPVGLLLLTTAPVILGTLLLLPVRSGSFEDSPQPRDVAPHRETCHAPIVTFLLALFVPFYFIFWTARIHRDIRSYSQSLSLLTPRGAGWMILLIPFAMPFMLSTLSDCIRLLLQDRQQPEGFSTGLIIFASLVFPPLGAALTQRQMNRLITAH